MERKIYEAPEAEVFVMEVNRMLDGSVRSVGSNLGSDSFSWGGASPSSGSSDYAKGEPRSKERGGDDFDWDLGF